MLCVNLFVILSAFRVALKSSSTRKKFYVKVKWMDVEVMCLYFGV